MRRFLPALVVLLLVAGAADAQKFKYVGVKKCKTCHKKEKIGDQYGKWLQGPHAKAFEALKSDTAKKVAAQLGIEDPTKSERCLRCHTTGFGEGGYDLNASPDHNAKFEGVQCEACHGPGSAYRKLKVMKGIAAGELDPKDYGLLYPKEEDCRRCHTPEDNPFYKEFNFDEFFKKIAHPVPKKKES